MSYYCLNFFIQFEYVKCFDELVIKKGVFKLFIVVVVFVLWLLFDVVDQCEVGIVKWLDCLLCQVECLECDQNIQIEMLVLFICYYFMVSMLVFEVY